ncbi:MAG TPA: cyclase family protein [Candidatus Binatia bacterium]|nr:cyclase family protein [Candidatus Binatia bacterium]
MKTLCLIILLALAALPASAVDERKLVDMTYPFNENTQHWPTANGFKLDKHTEGMTPDGHWYAAYDYSSAEHLGTHMDAPFHFAQGKWKVDEVPLAKTVGQAIVIDVSGKAKANADYRLQVADLNTWEKRYGRIAPGTIVLMYSGWGRFWKDRKQYFGSEQPGDVDHLRFPGYSKEAAEFLVNERKIAAAGIDTASMDYGASHDFIVHQVFGNANVPTFENVANLDKLPAKGAMVYAAPMKIEGGTGAPLRIFAILP